ncbi:benzoate 4-monooxygenase cytochrome P450 [Cryphonectria parasitica EP155]|uniref:Benzoate 4-monooxygenase cytochrome P450 n=1 Tax=Cryphonectria parasitica (strain ATCC 38755 / EP155) TaxID=660469 RepID=A0A9P4Y9V1_CRYP1|nr:benzoate 4-monooxygenase cytochrome P450 [Cryphonectria parasitica EP155]KAF3769441.1 benzoate 4-monooxygenase cytochrome P450 [Cryphonectria parasitica EP155]
MFIYLVLKIVHALRYTDLNHIPGPKLNALSMIPYARHMLAGSTVENSVRLHREYGDVVRIGPKEVSFISGDTAFPDIYGFRTGKLKGHRNMYKDPAWYVKPENGVPSILHADDEDHSRGRRVLAHAFSERAVTAQEALLQGYVDQLVGRLQEVTTQSQEPVDMVKWYNWTTFDVIADLMFGQPFGCLQDLSTHNIVALLLESFKSLRILYVLKHFPWLKYLGNLAVDSSLIQKRKQYLSWVSAQVTKRIERDTARPDFMTLILANNGKKGVELSRAEINSNANLMLNAGSETTASLLSAATWFLLKNPVAKQKLQDEIRGKFSRYQDITLAALGETPYLSACLSESLRLFPPVPAGFGRVVNKGGEYVSGVFIPEGTVVSVSHYAAYHSERNFKDPDDFVPERWLGDERYAGDNKAGWQPFSFGPRSCLGRNLAWAEMRLIMAKILWSFDLELDQTSYDWLSRCKVMRLWVKPELAVRLRQVVRY